MKGESLFGSQRAELSWQLQLRFPASSSGCEEKLESLKLAGAHPDFRNSLIFFPFLLDMSIN